MSTMCRSPAKARITGWADQSALEGIPQAPHTHARHMLEIALAPSQRASYSRGLALWDKADHGRATIELHWTIQKVRWRLKRQSRRPVSGGRVLDVDTASKLLRIVVQMFPVVLKAPQPEECNFMGCGKLPMVRSSRSSACGCDSAPWEAKPSPGSRFVMSNGRSRGGAHYEGMACFGPETGSPRRRARPVARCAQATAC